MSKSIKQLVFCAMAIALGTILSLIKLYHFPFGGSITLFSMLIVSLPGYWFGIRTGLLTGAVYGILQLFLDPFILFPVQVILDYLLAFGALGLSGLFANQKNGLMKGYAVGVFGRYFFSTLSGWLFFGEYAWAGWGALPYSLVYNALCILSEGVLTLMILLTPIMKKAMLIGKNMVNN